MTTIEYGHLYIDGQWAAPASAERIRVTEAATEENLGSVPAATERDIDAAVGAARKAFDDPEGWATWSPARRSRPATPWCSSRRRRPCWTHSLWRRPRWRPGCRRGCSTSSRPAGDVGAYLVAHRGVDKVSFTGSTAAGRAIAETCGRLLRPVTLELGGKSAAIILDDADLTASLEPFFGATLLNNGQICWLCTRVLASRSRYDAVVETITALAQSLTIGDPLDPATKVGPLVSERQRHRVESYIAKGKADGARITTGGRRPEGFDRGWFVEPTIFAGVDPKATIAQEEIFGPVLAVIPYADEHEAVAIANDSEYGLGGSVWTADPERGASFARKVRSGTIGVNGYVNDPLAPFGGIKASGMGRELGPEGLQPFQLLKTIYLDEANDPA